MKLELGKKLYKYSSFYLMEYEVFGILEREDGLYWQIRCLSCKHGYKCEVLIKEDDNKKLKYVSMLNEDEGDRQYYWHTTEDKDFYCLTKKEALEKVLERSIKSCEKEISDLEERIKNKEQSIIEYKEKLKGLE